MLDNIDFENIKKQILPYFIKVYGNQYENLIIDKMKKIVPIFYSELSDKEMEMNTKLSQKRTELTLKFIKDNNIEIPREIEEAIMNSSYSTYHLAKVEDAKKLLNACFNGTEYTPIVYGGIDSVIQEETEVNYIINQSIDVLKNFNIDITPEEYNNWIKTEEAQNIFIYINKLKKSIKELDQEYNEYANQFTEIKNVIDKGKLIEKELNEKYLIEFLETIKENLSQNEQIKLEEYKNLTNQNWYRFTSSMPIFDIIGNSFYNNGLIEAFSNEAEEKLNNPKTYSFNKETIINNRIKYFKLLGIYKDDMPFEKFMQTEDAINNTPPKDKVDQLLEKKKEFCQKSKQEFSKVTSTYQENIEKLNSLNLKSNNDFNIDIILNKTIMINPAIRMNSFQNPELVTLLFFSPYKCLSEYKDVMFIHELNHCIETSILDYNNGKPIFKCGYEEINDYDDSHTRNYEQFSETQNQLIAMEITKLMHDDNIYIFDNPKTAKIKGGTSYEHQNMFCIDLWENYKNEIIESRIGATINPILNSIGTSTFEEINKIINEYAEIPYYQMMDDIINNRTSELTTKREYLIQKYSEIINRLFEKENNITNDIENSNKK